MASDIDLRRDRNRQREMNKEKARGREDISAKSPTMFLTSTWGIADELGVLCDVRCQHQLLVGGRAKDASVHPGK